MPDRRAIYIMGTARAGTTLLGIVLGNAEQAFNCGEIRKIPILEGIPHGFGAGTGNHRFWQRVVARYFGDAPADYVEMRRHTSSIEKHSSFLCTYLNCWPARRKAAYRNAVNRIFDAIFAESGASILIDSSKYPTRALALHRSLDVPFTVIHLRRRRAAVLRSFGKRGVEQPHKSRAAANLYYGAVSCMCGLVFRALPEDRRLRVEYEDLVRRPVEVLTEIGSRLRIDLTRVIELVANEKPLRVGYLFEGNRIRLEPEVTLARGGSVNPAARA